MDWRELLTPKRVFLMLTIGVVVFFLRQIFAILLPFLLGLFLAVLIEPVVAFGENRLKLSRNMSVLLTVAATVAFSGILLFAVATKAISQLIDLANLLPQYRETIIAVSNELFLLIEQLNEDLPAIISSNIQRSLEDFLRASELATRDFLNRVMATFASLPVLLVITLVTIVSTYFISKDKELLSRSLLKFVPEKWREQAHLTQKRIAVDLIGFLKGRMLLLLIASAVAAVGLILINTRYWMILAIIIGILDNIPVVGPGLIFTPWIIASFVLDNAERGFLLLLLYLVIFSFRQLIEPKVMGDSVGIHPLAMLLAMYGGVVIFGVIGIFVGPIIAIIIKAIISAGLFKPTNFPE